MSGRSSSYQLRDTNVARTPLRYRDYGAEQETEPARRTYVFMLFLIFNSLFLLPISVPAKIAKQLRL